MKVFSCNLLSRKIRISVSDFVQTPIWLFGLLLLIFACSPSTEEITYDSLLKYVADPDNGLRVGVERGPYMVQVTHRPSDLWIHQESNSLLIDSMLLAALQKKYADNYYFIVSISRNQHEALSPAEAGIANYSALLEILSFKMDRHVGLITSSNDTIAVRDFMLDRTYGMSNTTNLLFSFSKDKTSGQDWVEFTMNEFGLGIGAQRFRFRIKDLEAAPRLKFEIDSKRAG